MAIIRTVRGDITPEQLGICYPHEHLMGSPPPPYAEQDPDLVLDSDDKAVESLQAIKAAGGTALLEMTPIDYQRAPLALKRIADRADMHVIAVTGYLKEKFSKRLVDAQSVEQMTQRFVREIQHGMDETTVRAGAIKAASSMNVITDSERKVFEAAAQAQQATGALITTHTEAGTMALEQIDLLTGLGVPANRILIGHLDRNLDADLHQRIAQTGVYMGFDQIGKSKYATEAERIDMIKMLIDSGHVQQIMLSMDIARRSYLPAYGGKPGFAYLLTDFVPLLRSTGVTDDMIHVMLMENSVRALQIDV